MSVPEQIRDATPRKAALKTTTTISTDPSSQKVSLNQAKRMQEFSTPIQSIIHEMQDEYKPDNEEENGDQDTNDASLNLRSPRLNEASGWVGY